MMSSNFIDPIKFSIFINADKKSSSVAPGRRDKFNLVPLAAPEPVSDSKPVPGYKKEPSS